MHKYRITIISNPLEVDQTTLLDIVMLDDEAATKYAKDIYDKWEEDEARTCVIDEDNTCSLNENDLTLHEMTYTVLLSGVDTSHIETIENPDDLLDFDDLFDGVGIVDDNEAATNFITGKGNPEVLKVSLLTEDEIDDLVVECDDSEIIEFEHNGYYYIIGSNDNQEFTINIYSSDVKDTNGDYLEDNLLDGGVTEKSIGIRATLESIAEQGVNDEEI